MLNLFDILDMERLAGEVRDAIAFELEAAKGDQEQAITQLIAYPPDRALEGCDVQWWQRAIAEYKRGAAKS